MDYHADDCNGRFNSDYTVIKHSSAKRYIKRLPSNVQERVVGLIKDLSGNPYPSRCKKKQGVDDLYGFSIGSYRIYYIVQAKTKVVLIVWAGHHQVDFRRPKFWAKFR
ncbi:type II toxin-antitoxin system RelE/ParE family toxin [Phormidium sp. FACHB-592]|uniref:Type II toxin-antitoxin system RelE/ParE family toxin n=1 Tax=Stenomitos frigidus AS-A4 TaxID=2933935 RepID=A0ABV0KU11_9CYAN|nr:type II toxin-antitoxin system RelE/ParE family toxin [Phormidium sp. FACHB-592]MBD2077945.1 type II toxin-antitoxin system RelE/ParE family toxin [Phormidium sp. FACHB-592]